MKTNRNCRMLGNLVLVLASALVLAASAGAQSAIYAGKFTLPFEARWGLATLPAGDYEFTMASNSPPTIEVFRGTRAVAQICASQGSSRVQAGRAALTVVRTSNGNTVRDLSLPDLGMELHYAPHRPGRRSAAAEREIAQVVSVPIEGK